jgi:hypothetical protein
MANRKRLVKENPIDRVARQAVEAYRKALPGAVINAPWGDADFQIASAAVRDYTARLTQEQMDREFMAADFFEYVAPHDAVRILRRVLLKSMKKAA